MQCRHTVPDWHRYVVAGEEAQAIFAGCRLLVRNGERARDPRSIACSYWGRQRECPVYDGPESRPDSRSNRTVPPSVTDAPVAAGSVWPVRPPGAIDGQRILLIALGWLSIALLGSAIALGLAALGAEAPPTGYLIVALVAGVLSLVTHVLSLLRLWAGR